MRLRVACKTTQSCVAYPTPGVFLISMLFDVAYTQPCVADALPSSDQVRLTPSIRSMKGHIWNNITYEAEHWEVEITLRVSGRGSVGGDGMVSEGVAMLAFFFLLFTLGKNKVQAPHYQHRKTTVLINCQAAQMPISFAFVYRGEAPWCE